MNLPRKKIEEVRVRLAKEPTIREIYVEGVFDRDFFRWVLKNLGLEDVRVYPISTLDIPLEYLEANNLTSGERQRIIAAAKLFELDTALHNRLAFVVDADTDYVLDQANYQAPLMGTGGTSAEVILWRKDLLKKFLSLGLGSGSPEQAANELMEYVEPIAISLCVFRAAKEISGMKWNLIDVEDAIDRKSGFCFDTYCKKVGDKNAARRFIDNEFQDTLKVISQKAEQLETQKKVHGHDLIAAMGRKLTIDGYGQSFLKDAMALGRVLMTSLEWEFVRDDITIEKINDRFSRTATHTS